VPVIVMTDSWPLVRGSLRGKPVVLRRNSVRREVVDLPAPIRRRSAFDDHPPAPAASPPALSLRRPPPARPREPRLAPAAVVYKRTVPRPKLRTTDRLFWVALVRVWAGWRQPLV